jgi:NADH-quinone oxidoreductase subunit M
MPGLLSALIFLPICAGLALLLVPARQVPVFRWANVIANFAMLLLAGAVAYQYGQAGPATDGESLQFLEYQPWLAVDLGSLGRLSAAYFLGVDGLNVALVLLSGLVLFLGAVASWEIGDKVKGYTVLYLLLGGSVMGCFVALDFLLFFLFFEFMLLPMYFLVGIWGGERREYAALKFFLYTFLGSVLVLVVMIGLYLSAQDPGQAGQHTFHLLHLADPANYLPGSLLAPGSGATVLGVPARLAAFGLLLVGFGIKLPAVPLHTWLPDAHVEAPTPVSVVLAGVLLKIGAYGLLRIAYPLFPAEAAQLGWWVGLVGAISILYGALVALGQTNLKKMIAYSSVSHMGYVLLGLAAATPEAVNGVIYQLFSHGVLSAMLFLCAGVLYARTHELDMAAYRGLAVPMPRYAAMVGVAFFASLGLPGFSAFMAELLVYLGAFRSGALPAWMPLMALLSLVVGAGYFLWALQRVFLGPFSVREPGLGHRLTDLTGREWVLLAVPAVLAVVFGLFPNLLLHLSDATVKTWLAR